MTGRYLEDFAVGQTFGSGALKIDEERIKVFATEFDPQPFHILIGIWFEERGLVAQFGEQYRRYREQVGMLLPGRKAQ